ncbi:MAG: dynein heavy chain and region D6 of dynein motor-domain-containing protein [Monoraphidium minutum]|nr:MAG: dynein heavy chain and region D6 of dynein motor-domain-containing protein [Monoraphidium minutum]
MSSGTGAMSGAAAGGDPFAAAAGTSAAPGAPLLWALDEVLQGTTLQPAAAGGDSQEHGAEGGPHGLEEGFVRRQEQLVADKARNGVAEQRRRLPAVINDRALFTRAVPFGGRGYPPCRGPSGRIGAQYSPAADAHAARAAKGAAAGAPGHPGHDARAAAMASPPPPPGALAHPLAHAPHQLPPLRASGAVAAPMSGSLRAGSPGATVFGTTPGTLGPRTRSPSPTRVGKPLRATSPGPYTSGSGGAASSSGGGAAAAASPCGGRQISKGGGGGGGDGSFLELEMADAMMRYQYYIERGVDARHVAPFREEWLGGALALLPADAPARVGEERRAAILEGCADELRADYERAVKKAVLDYVVASPAERQRLQLEPLEPLIRPPPYSAAPPAAAALRGSGGAYYCAPAYPTSASAAAERRLPPEWGAHVAAAREEVAWTLQTLNPNALELRRIWFEAGYAGARLLDVESGSFLARLPAQAEAFRSYQLAACDQLRSQLAGHWLPKCADVFRRLPPVPINGDAAAYFRAVATLQGNQLRQLVAASLDDYLALFRRHVLDPPPGGGGAAPACAPLDAQRADAMWSCPAVFETELVVEAGAAAFRPPLAASEAAALAALDATVTAVAGLPRIGRAALASGGGLGAPASASTSGSGGGGGAAAIPVAGLGDSDVETARQELRAILSASAEAPRQLAALFSEYLPLLDLDPQLHARRAFEACGGAPPPAAPAPAPRLSASRGAAAAGGQPGGGGGGGGLGGAGALDLEAYGREVERLMAAAAGVWGTCAGDVRAGLYSVKTSGFKAQLAAAAEAAVAALLELLRVQVRESNERAAREYAAMAAEMARTPASGEEALTLKKYIGRCGIENERFKEAIAANKAREEFLCKYRHPLPEDDFDAARRAYEWPRRAGDLLRDAMARAAAEHRAFEGALKARRKAFAEVLERCAADLAAAEAKGDVVRREATAAEVEALAERLGAAGREAEDINAQEKMFGWQPTKYGHVARLAATLEPYVQLWATVNAFYDKHADWMNGPFWKVDAEAAEADTADAARRLLKLSKAFGGGGGAEPKPVPLAVAEEARAKVAAFQAHVPLLVAVCNPGLRDRHWAAVAEAAGFEVHRDEATSLKRLLEGGLAEHVARLTEISDAASREAAIQRALDKMAADWERLAFELGPWRETGTFILKGGPIEEAQMLLDDHVVKAQAMASSPASRPFAERIGPWEAKLRLFQDMLEEWLRCQGKWLYLQPIFGAEEIMRHIPREGGAFRRARDAGAWRLGCGPVHRYGYLDARSLARKLVQTYRLCSEQLSSQDHYDYGMRAIVSVLRAAGNLKRAFPGAGEDVLMLRAVRDVNVPKFLDQDVPLFNGILSDLFPGVEPPVVDYDALRAALADNCARAGLQPLESFMVKAIQLYEMILVRHGLMLVGASYGMKTTACRALAGALSDMAARGEGGEVAVKMVALNPKAVTMGQLYGQEDPVSLEWTDGVLPALFRAAARDTSLDRKWLVFDGPVDAVWIENMNTVLDDNKKLCLSSGEIIAMQARGAHHTPSPAAIGHIIGLMSLIFEVADLAAASPATVSRCGMVYVQPDLLGWRPVLESWLAALPEAVTSEDRRELEELAAWLLPPCLRAASKGCSQVLPLHGISLAASCMRLVEAHVSDLISAGELAADVAPERRGALLQGAFLFGLVWSVGANTDGEGRARFDAALRRLIAAGAGRGEPPPELAAWVSAPVAPLTVPFPEGRSVYDYVFDSAKARWQPWTDRLDSRAIPPEAEFTSIIVPTTDTLRYTYLLDVLARAHRHVLFVGPTGTGKTAFVKRHLATGLPAAVFATCLLNFSAQTSANTTQDIIDARLDKRRRGVWGPAGGRSMVVFVDDLNMPQPEQYGAQPPVELLRQLLDHGGWYDRKDLSMRALEGLQLVAAMGPPGGGRNAVTGRFLRHFNVVSVTAFDRDNLGLIFGALTDWWLSKWGYGAGVTRLARPLVAATLDVYEHVQAKLLPTPAKSHYTFNLRDVSKVFQGMAKAANCVDDAPDLVRLWVHEVLRVFYDRLVCDEDRLWTGRLLEALAEQHFKERLGRLLAAPPAAGGAAGGGGDGGAGGGGGGGALGDVELAAGLRGLMFGDFLGAPGEARQYRRLDCRAKLLAAVSEALAEMNAGSKRPMQLVLFQFALEHVARIGRVLGQPGGHALLVGLGGSGRQSLTRLAAYMAEMELVQIEISKAYGQEEWHEDLRKLLRRAGEAGKQVVFLLSDTQCRSEAWVEDVSNLLNTGEVPNLLAPGDMAAIAEAMRPRAKAAGRDAASRDDMAAFFLEEVRRNLHIVLSFSPVGDAFRERLRRFPSLVNCTTIDWFTAWPRDALHSVAASALAGLPGVSDDAAAALPGVAVALHEGVAALAARFLAEQRRHYYVTPTSYLELLGSYKKLLARRQDEVMTAKRRYEVGLDKLATTEESGELTALHPQLEESGRETAAAMEAIALRSAEADKVKVVVQREEAVAAGEAAKVKAIKDECEADLAEALPALEAAMRALDTLTKNDITEVKGMKSPPAGVKLVLEAVCVLKGAKPVRSKDTATGQMVDNYWEVSKKMLMEDDFLGGLKRYDKDHIGLMEDDFLGGLKRYDKDHIEPAVVKRIQGYVASPDFMPEKIQQASQAAYGLCCWVRAIESYDRRGVAKVVAPKRAALAEAEAQLGAVMEDLATKQAELKRVLDQLAALDRDLREKTARKEALEAEARLCRVKLDRAHKLIAGERPGPGGLGNEKTRWRDAAAALGRQYVSLAGDVLLAAAQIAYLGPFTQGYRSEALRSWEATCRAAGIPCHAGFRLSAALGDPVKVRHWNICGLPKDDFSTDNAIAIEQGGRWPLAIDPQGLANKWVRALEGPSGLLAVKQSDAGFLRTLENAIQFGKPVLLENVGEALDATLEPLLTRAVFKQGGASCIKLGDAVVEYSDAFRLYITTKLRNPHYAPEVCTKVSLLNFSTTLEGLEDQLLQVLVAAERPDLEEEKNRLILAGAANKRRLKETEDEILRVLSASSGNILEDEAAVNVLQASKVLADDITAKQEVADATEAQIDAARQGYQPVAHHASLLYFCCVDLGALDPMYQFSLPWFRSLFSRAIAESGRSDVLAEHLALLAEHLTAFLFQNVCRRAGAAAESLFEKDKLLFALLLATKVKLDAGALGHAELRFLLTGGLAVGEPPHPNPAPVWVSHKMWGEACRAEGLGAAWEGLPQHIADNAFEWRAVYDSPAPQAAALPAPWGARLDAFQRLLLLRILRPDKLAAGLSAYVADTMGPHFVEPRPFDLAPCFADSSPSAPLIFLLSPGADPMGSLLRFAEERGVRVESVSLGQGQGPVARRWVEEGAAQGFWVVLQNCHLARSFLPALEAIVETQLSAEGRVHPNFRLWLTSDPTPDFPVSLLEAGVKITNERPKGLRAGLLRTYTSDPVASPDLFEGCAKPGPFKALLFGLAFFHSVCLERRQFGPIGWNIPYEFNDNDLRISVRQLRLFLDEYPEVPFEALAYTAGECNYGGKVTDAHDRLLLSTLLGAFYTPALLGPGAPLCAGGGYAVPHAGEHKSYVEHIQGLPLLTPPEAFGLGPNADIARDLREGGALLEALLAAQARLSQGWGRQDAPPAPAAAAPPVAGSAAPAAPPPGPEAVVGGLARGILARLPECFDIEAAEARYPQDYYNSMNTVLVQELVRFNALAAVMRSSLAALAQAVDGLAVMSAELDELGRSLFDGKVPALWLRRSFPSAKPLGSYVADVLARAAFFGRWLEAGPPAAFWLPGFFFTQAFLTGAKQNYARRHRLAIDSVDFDFAVLDDLPLDGGQAPLAAPLSSGGAAAAAAEPGAAGEQPGGGEGKQEGGMRAPEDGVYCYGLFLEGARWDGGGHALAEAAPKVMYSPMPVIWFLPRDAAAISDGRAPRYACPLYKTPERRGVLSTTGHSTNFVTDVRLAAGDPGRTPPAHWARRGAALLASLAD